MVNYKLISLFSVVFKFFELLIKEYVFAFLLIINFVIIGNMISYGNALVNKPDY